LLFVFEGKACSVIAEMFAGLICDALGASKNSLWDMKSDRAGQRRLAQRYLFRIIFQILTEELLILNLV
jgi:hypothetical protein